MFNPMWFVILLGAGARSFGSRIECGAGSPPASEATKRLASKFINENLFKPYAA